MSMALSMAAPDVFRQFVLFSLLLVYHLNCQCSRRKDHHALHIYSNISAGR